VTTAKQEKTKLDRIAKVVSLCSEGNTLNEKYVSLARQTKKGIKRAQTSSSSDNDDSVEEEVEAELKKVKKTTQNIKK